MKRLSRYVGTAALSAAMLFCSSCGDRNQYDGAIFSYKGDFLGYLGLKDMGVFTSAGGVSDEMLAKIRKFGESL